MTDSFALRTELSVGEPLNDAPPPISNVPSGNLKPAISTNLPEEDDLVDALIPWMPNGKGVIDAGGNTGRNSLVWALLGHRVDMFEQNPTSIELARHYAEINQVADAITFHRVTLGTGRDAMGTPQSAPVSSPARAFDAPSHDEATVTLDSFALSNVGLLRVSIFDPELKVLVGSSETIRRERPVLAVTTPSLEILTNLLDWASPLGYVSWETLGSSRTQLLVPFERVTPSALLDQVGKARLAMFESGTQLEKYRRQLEHLTRLHQDSGIHETHAVVQDELSSVDATAEIEMYEAQLSHGNSVLDSAGHSASEFKLALDRERARAEEFEVQAQEAERQAKQHHAMNTVLLLMSDKRSKRVASQIRSKDTQLARTREQLNAARAQAKKLEAELGESQKVSRSLRDSVESQAGEKSTTARGSKSSVFKVPRSLSRSAKKERS